MTFQFIAYDVIAVAAWLVALVVIRPRNALDLSRAVGWYLLGFLATYVVRPSASEIVGDFTMYDWLRIGRFEEHWQLMAVAVPLALLSFAIGYGAAGPSHRAMRVPVRQQPEPIVDPHRVRVLIFSILLVGYVSALFVLKFGGGAETLRDTISTTGAYQHNTAWFAQDDLLITSATVLYYILTGRLGMSLLLSGPWMVMRVLYGYGRTNLIGHFFAFMAVYFLKNRAVKGNQAKSNQALVISAGLLAVLVLFPLMGMLRGLKRELGIGSLYSKDAILILGSHTDAEDLVQDYFGTNSPVSGFEMTLSHLLYDRRSELGTQYLYYYFFQPIPRIIWPGKGSPYTWPKKLRGVEVDPRLGLIGAAAGSIGIAFEQWGWLGIPFEFILTGLIIRKWEEAAQRRPRALHVQLGYAGLYSLLPQINRDGLLYMLANFWLFKFGMPVFILWIMYKGAVEKRRWRKEGTFSPLSGAAIAPGAAR